MSRKLYVGNLSHDCGDSELEKLFSDQGTVESVQVIQDRNTGKSRGFGFVEMSSAEEAQAAILALNGKDLGDRAIKVNEAKPQTERSNGRRW